MIDLYTWTTPNGRKACIALEELGLPYTRIPAIVDRDNGMSLMESGAILDLSRRQDRQVVAEVRRGALSRARMAAGPMFGQVHHFVKYNEGKAPYAEERFLKEAHLLYGALESRLAQGMGSDAAAPGLYSFVHGTPPIPRTPRHAYHLGYGLPRRGEDEAEGATPGFSA